MDSTTRVTGLTFAEACALREAAGHRVRGRNGMDDTTGAGGAGWYRTRQRLNEVQIGLAAAALATVELVLAVAVWVIAMVAPLARSTSEWVSRAATAADGVLDPAGSPTAAPRPGRERQDPRGTAAADRDDGLPTVVDGEVLTAQNETRNVDKEGV